MKKSHFGTEQYNNRYKSSSERAPRNVIKLFVNKYLKKGQSCLDLGCGGGRHSEYLAKQGLNVTAIDLSAVGVEKTKELLKKYPNSIAMVANMHTLPFKKNSFDCLISNRVLDHNDTGGAETTMSEISRVLKPYSMIFITVASIRQNIGTNNKILEQNEFGGITFIKAESEILHHYYSKDEIRELAKNNNFEVVEITENTKTDQKGDLKIELQITMRKIENAIYNVKKMFLK